jgi:hypothetical protein
MNISTFAAFLTLLVSNASALSSITSVPRDSVATSASPISKSPTYEYLKFDRNPQFDVLEKAKEYQKYQEVGERPPEEMYAEDYVLRGPVIGPLTRADLADTSQGLGVGGAYPDLKIEQFGLTLDPENPYRCFYFQRWRGTFTVDLDMFGKNYPASGKEMETPVSCFSIVFNPEGKIVYESVGAVVDRHEGNTKGLAAVFGMLYTAGVQLPSGSALSFFQKLGHVTGNTGRSWSKKSLVPSWWKSKSRGAEPTDQL